MTVADIFVDIGKARADGHDQRAIVRVVQKPTPDYHQRFTSVERDWSNTGATDWRQQRYRDKRNTAVQFSPIAEEQRPRDAPLPSVENETISGTPSRSLDNEELGGPYSPQEQNRESKKRKTSTESSGPAKHRRIEDEQPTLSSVSPQRKRTNVPTFASPHRRPSLTERTAPNESIGLGVTKSPLSKKSAQANIPSSQNNATVSTPQPAGKHLHSAMRKSSPLTAHSEQRRSVSFNEPIVNGAAQSTPQVNSSQSKASQKKATHKGRKPTSSDAQESPYTPSNRNTMTPDQQQQKQMDDQFARIKQGLEAKEKARLRKDLQNPDISTASKDIIKKLLKTFESIEVAKNNAKANNGGEDQSRYISNLQRKLPSLRNKLAQSRDKKDAEKAPEPSLPVSEATITRSIPSPVADRSAAPAASQPETWSFGSIAPSSTGKLESQSQPTPIRRVTRSSASASQESMPWKSPSKSPAPRQSSSASVAVRSPPKLNRVDTQPPVEGSNVDVQEETEPPRPKDAQQDDVEMEDAESEEDSSENSSSEESSSDESVNDGETSAVKVSKADERMDEDNADQADVDGSDEKAESPNGSPAMANGFIDGAADEDSEEDDEAQDEAEEGDEMKDFIDDGSERTEDSEDSEESEESEEEQAEDEDSGENAKAEATEAQVAEEQVEESAENNEQDDAQDEAQDEAQAKSQADKSQGVEGDHDEPNQLEPPSKEQDDSEYESLDNSDDSDSEIE